MKNIILLIIFGIFLSISKAEDKLDCTGINIKFPIIIDGKNYYCGKNLGEGAFGVFFSLIDENHVDSEFGIKVFHVENPSRVKSEAEDINFMKKYFKSVPEVIQYSNQESDQKNLDYSNYIIKKRIDGTDLPH